MARKWKPCGPASVWNRLQTCKSKHGQAYIWPNSAQDWFLSVGAVALSEDEAKKLSEVLLDTLARCKKGP